MEVLFAAIVADLATVHDAYAKAGLLQVSDTGSLACALLGGSEEANLFQRDALLLDAVVRHRIAHLVFDRHGPRHIVVFGGNNVGKSTVVNILAAASIASTSPEGGHTRHAQAFSAAAGPLFTWNAHAFTRFNQVAADRLTAERFDDYAVRPIIAGALPSDIVLWDAPDIDAVGSTRYLAAVVEAIATADLIVYVTSVEKYAVASLVEWLFQLHDIGIPILGCLNKTSKRDRLLVLKKQAEDVLPAMAQQLQLPIPELPMVALRYMADGEEADLWGTDHPEASTLRDAALAALRNPDDVNAGRTALRFARRRIEPVLEPARMELYVRQAWTSMVLSAVAGFVTTYENKYLKGATVIDPFTQLNAALLELLNPDIPKLGQAIRRLRAVQRVPFGLLKKGWQWVTESGEMPEDARLAPEQRVYTMAHRALLHSLTEQIEHERRNPRHHPFWDELAREWKQQTVRLADEFGQATIEHMRKTDAEIRAAAGDILQALQQRPQVLNVLRAARVSTDIGGLLVGFIVPGHGHIAHDLLEQIVIAPLMLSATGAAADLVVEGYVAQRRNQIVDKLRANARDMATVLYFKPLEDIAESVMARVGTLQIGQEVLDRIVANLQRLQEAVACQPAQAPA